MTDPQKDTQRALAAAKIILDGRDPRAETGAVMVTLENLVALMLLAAMNNEHRKAAKRWATETGDKYSKKYNRSRQKKGRALGTTPFRLRQPHAACWARQCAQPQ